MTRFSVRFVGDSHSLTGAESAAKDYLALEGLGNRSLELIKKLNAFSDRGQRMGVAQSDD
jgi:hypothetical protein